MIDLTKLTDLELITLTIIGEARGEPIEGQVGVGSVILNRSRTYKDTIYNVVLRPMQFSCWNSNDPNRFILEEIADKLLLGQKLDNYYSQCLCVARGLIDNEIRDNTNGALHYLTSALFNSDKKPSWAKHITYSVVKGKQIFFNILGEK